MRKPRLRRLLGCWQVTEWEVIEPRFQPSQTDSKPIYSLKKSILLAVKVQIVPSATGSQMPRRADSQERGGQWRDQERLLALHPCLLHPELSALLLFDCIIGTCWFKIASSPVLLLGQQESTKLTPEIVIFPVQWNCLRFAGTEAYQPISRYICVDLSIIINIMVCLFN